MQRARLARLEILASLDLPDQVDLPVLSVLLEPLEQQVRKVKRATKELQVMKVELAFLVRPALPGLLVMPALRGRLVSREQLVIQGRPAHTELPETLAVPVTPE